jgi:microcystin-dependent protein
MGRCNCSDQRCNCVIQQGEGVTITGTGRPGDPYVVTAEAGGGGGGGSGFDPGDLKWTAKVAAPAGWLIANGQAVSRSSYAALFAAIGTIYGTGDGTTTFNLPDYTGRFMLGVDADHPAGSSGGSETKTLAIANMPAHTHTINHDHGAFGATTAAAGAHDHATSSSDDTTAVDSAHFKRAGTNGAAVNNNLVGTAGAHAHTLTINTPAFAGDSGSVGNGQPFNAMPPYTTATPLVKT